MFSLLIIPFAIDWCRKNSLRFSPSPTSLNQDRTRSYSKVSTIPTEPLTAIRSEPATISTQRSSVLTITPPMGLIFSRGLTSWGMRISTTPILHFCLFLTAQPWLNISKLASPLCCKTLMNFTGTRPSHWSAASNFTQLASIPLAISARYSRYGAPQTLRILTLLSSWLTFKLGFFFLPIILYFKVRSFVLQDPLNIVQSVFHLRPRVSYFQNVICTQHAPWGSFSPFRQHLMCDAKDLFVNNPQLLEDDQPERETGN